jgi:hypothetical protein
LGAQAGLRGATSLSDVARIQLAPGNDWDDVRAAIRDWATRDGAVIRMDRPLRDADGRHFHIAAPTVGSDTDGGQAWVEIVCRPHWAGTWAGRSMLDLVQALAASLGPRT